VSMADAQYDAAVADLEKALKADRDRLDASTIAIVEHNLQIIDQAIDQARRALEADPANGYLSGHLAEARRRKLDLLRRAAALTSANN
jgi:Tfp pilus assembly protein PilF